MLRREGTRLLKPVASLQVQLSASMEEVTAAKGLASGKLSHVVSMCKLQRKVERGGVEDPSKSQEKVF